MPVQVIFLRMDSDVWSACFYWAKLLADEIESIPFSYREKMKVREREREITKEDDKDTNIEKRKAPKRLDFCRRSRWISFVSECCRRLS